MSNVIRVFTFPLFLSVVFCAGEVSASDQPPAWLDWQTVGTSTLRWGFWDIYDASLKTPSGRYHAGTKVSALVIEYRRAINKQKLLKATDDQWQHLGIDPQQRRAWLKVLAGIWVSVDEGDRLTFVLTPAGGHFYFGQRSLGRITSREMAQAFLGIWLSKDTAYPSLRLQLMGKE